MGTGASPMRLIIMGAAGRDFHVFNTSFRDDPAYEVVAFTATQIPNITDRRYPAELAGARYANGIPIFAESDLGALMLRLRADAVVFAYSDVSAQYVMERAAQVNAAGVDFWLLGARATTLKSAVPVVAVCAVRTGCGKSAVTRRVTELLR